LPFSKLAGSLPPEAKELFMPSWVWTTFGLLSIPLLVALNGLFVAAECALVAVRRTRVEEMIAQGKKGAKAVEYALVDQNRSIATTQLGITLASLTLGWVGVALLAGLLEPAFAYLPLGWSAVAAHTVAVVVAFMLITFMHVVFGQFVPKIMALQNPAGMALRLARPTLVFLELNRPVVFLMNVTGNVILHWCGLHPTKGSDMARSLEEPALSIEEASGIPTQAQADVVEKTATASQGPSLGGGGQG
jgi:putative hemolysin